MRKSFLFIALALLIASNSIGQKNKENESNTDVYSKSINALKFRSVGPALNSGRISDLAIHPKDPNTWLIAVASGGVWRTTNHGNTFEPVFDHQKVYSIASVTYSLSNPNTVWVGTGENNNQRSVAYGDGVYKSLDGGKTFKNMGLKNSEHIGNIIIHPNDENIVWVSAYGPLWKSGGERGVYKTINGGETWTKTLDISENTGVSEIVIDPKNPEVLYAAAHQRRRHVYTYIGGGPESAVYKSTDGGETWKTINSGLPEGKMGRIGLAVSPVNTNTIYAIVEAKNDTGGFYKSTNKGESWKKQSDYSTSGNYYQEIICDPKDENKVFSMNTYLHHTEDGGKSFMRTGESKKHVDNHTIWINPQNTDHWIVGCDGGIYETYNHAKHWKFYSNLPVTQFYRVAVDNAEPFYNIYGGTQDNNSMGGPSATTNRAGILNTDWFITNGGDGFESQIDPEDPTISYAQAQYGWLVRYDKKSGEKLGIQPMPKENEAAYRWNWDAPLLISPHDNKTIYFAANKLFKSTNRGNSWTIISPDLTQQLDRNTLPVMGQVWGKDAVMKNKSTTIYGNIVALDESSVKKGLLYVGTDDGLIHISEDDGRNWKKINTPSEVPKNTYVNAVVSSLYSQNTVFAVFNNHKNGDFKPYVFVSKNKGLKWQNISNNLPENGAVFCIRQDHINPDLLFVGTEFGVYFSSNFGDSWTQLKAGLPTIAIRDLEIQKRENDLVLASFGRGFYVLDDYSPLRQLSKEVENQRAYLFPVKDAKLFIPSSPGTGSEGANFYTAKNPAFGATFTLHIKEVEESLKKQREKKEKELEKNGSAVTYPTLEELNKERLEEHERLIWIIRNEAGKEINRIISSPSEGLSRITWNLRTESTDPIRDRTKKTGLYSNKDWGTLVSAGVYSVEVVHEKDGIITPYVAKTKFNVVSINPSTLANEDENENLVFGNSVLELNRKIAGTEEILKETKEKLNLFKSAVIEYPNTKLSLLTELNVIENKLDSISILMYGDPIKKSLEMEARPSITGRISTVQWQRYGTTSAPTQTQKDAIEIVQKQYETIRPIIDQIVGDIDGIEKQLEQINLPYIKEKGIRFKKD